MLAFVAACGDDEGATPRPGQPGVGSITGSVRDDAGNPVVGATVGTSPATTIALTDAQGNFRIDDVEPGSYAVVASKEGFTSDVETVTVTANQTANVSLVLTPSGPAGDTLGNVTGLVLRRSGQPVPEGTTVEIFRDQSTCTTDATPDETATTDAGGRFVIEDLSPGNYLACVTVTIGGVEFTGRTAFVVNAGEITQADITVGRDADQTTEPNVGGELIDLDENGNFNGIIRFVDIDGDGDDELDCNLIQTQHLWVVEVIHDLNNNGVVNTGEPLVSGVRVEWSLNQGGTVFNPFINGEFFVQGTTGVIVDTDDPFLDPVQAESAKTAQSGAAPQFKVDDTHAVTYTNDTDQVLDFGGDVVTIGEGQTWIIVTSPNEGFTDVVAFSPDLSRATFPEGDKAFAVKRWVNWRIEVAELSPSDTEDGVADTLSASLVADGGTLTNRLDRTPVFGTLGPGSCTFANTGVSGNQVGAICDLSNRAFLGIAITQFRTDRPMTFIAGSVEVTLTDTIPDSEIEDIDSDEELGGAGFAGGGFINATQDFAAADFLLDTPVSFQCEPNPGDPEECADVDVVLGTNTLGQDLSDLGFTVTTGAEDFQGAVAVTVALDSLRFFAFADTLSPVGFSFSEDLQRLIDGQADNQIEITIDVLDEFGEVCDQIVITKEWITSILRIFKQGPTTVGLDDVFEYTVTVVNDGDDLSTDVVIADTLPILNDPTNPLGPVPADTARDGNQAFRYVTDDPTFDPDGIRYYIDTNDDEPGTTSNVCFEAPVPGFPPPSAFPTDPVLCPVVVTFPTIAAARDAAEAVSAGGSAATPLTGDTVADQVVIVEYFDFDVLSRTAPGGAIEAEDSFEITVEAIHSVNEFRLASGAIPTRTQRNGQWCNIATVTSAENDFAADSVCTRVVEALLEVRKTADDAIVVAGDQAEFLIEIGNNGSEPLTNVTVSDTLDVGFTVPSDTVNQPGLVMVDTTGVCEGCTFEVDTIASGATTITFTIPEVPPTDTNNNGVFDDNEGFTVATIVTRTPLRQGTFCNRVTVSTDEGLEDTDIACVVTQVEIEFDIVNTDGLLDATGVFQDVETFQVGDSIAYQTSITNRSNVAATNVQILWEIAPEFRIIEFVRILNEDPAAISCSTASDTCSVTVASLAPGGVVVLDYLTIANFSGNDVNRITLTANELSLPVVNEEPTTVNP